jgi:hypothetical protein
VAGQLAAQPSAQLAGQLTNGRVFVLTFFFNFRFRFGGKQAHQLILQQKENTGVPTSEKWIRNSLIKTARSSTFVERRHDRRYYHNQIYMFHTLPDRHLFGTPEMPSDRSRENTWSD